MLPFRRHAMSPSVSQRFLVGFVGSVLVAALAVIVRAAIPGPNGVINACYKNVNGTLRVVDDPASCQNSEASLSWGQIGPQGPTGAQGPQGPAGPTGPAGMSDAYTTTGAVGPIHDAGVGPYQVTSLTGL